MHFILYSKNDSKLRKILKAIEKKIFFFRKLFITNFMIGIFCSVCSKSGYCLNIASIVFFTKTEIQKACVALINGPKTMNH